MARTATLDQFLGQLASLVASRDGQEINNFLVVEPPFGNLYIGMIAELKQAFPKGSEPVLQQKIESALTVAANWSAFHRFLTAYLAFIRDVNTDNLLETYDLLNELLQKCNRALEHGESGVLMLQTTVTYSRMLSRLAIGLDKRPDLIAHLVHHSSEDAAETLPERAANTVITGFTKCLIDKNVAGSHAEGKKAGIYKLANICLKILFLCNKTRNAEQIFINVYQQSPPLSLYSRAERVTYLYYLGRFYFINNHFLRSLEVLNAAYGECHAQATKQRRLILVHLIASNLVLGRFPSRTLLQRPEAAGMAEVFLPICQAIAKGDLTSFRRLTHMSSPGARWLWRYRILLQIQNRAEVLVWRSLARKTYLLCGTDPADGKRAPTFDLDDFLVLLNFLEKQAMLELSPTGTLDETGEPELPVYVDPDLEDTDDADDAQPDLPDMLEAESICSALINQGFLGAFISHKQRRVAIQGARRSSPLEAGFPNVWQTIVSRESDGDDVPGWKKASDTGGMVVNLKGARPVGAGA